MLNSGTGLRCLVWMILLYMPYGVAHACVCRVIEEGSNDISNAWQPVLCDRLLDLYLLVNVGIRRTRCGVRLAMDDLTRKSSGIDAGANVLKKDTGHGP